MAIRNNTTYLTLLFLAVASTACHIPGNLQKTENRSVPAAYRNSMDTTNIAHINWADYFSDSNLVALIDTALLHNQELNIVQQEIAISQNEIRARKGEYLPFIGVAAAGDYEKTGRYTWRNGVEENINNVKDPELLESRSDFIFGATASWELDVWKKLRNAKAAAAEKYLAGIEGRHFLVTTLIAELAASYYELMMLDNLVEIVEKNVLLQQDALTVAREQKEAAKLTQLAVNRFEAQLLRTQNILNDLRQRIIETENRINFLSGRFPSPIKRNSSAFFSLFPDTLQAGIPSQLLTNRPDIRRAEHDLAATRLEVKAARANFYPSFRITAQSGFQAFNPVYLVNPEALVFNLAGDLAAPLVNRNSIKASYYTANAKQVQAAYAYEQTVLQAHVDVVNELARLENTRKSVETKSQEVSLRTQSVAIAGSLFNSARADYVEVLFSQEEVLDARMELTEIQMQLIRAKINLYRALGGGWR